MDGGNFRNRYSEAYGNYQGGYGPKGGYNSVPPLPPPPGFFGPSGPPGPLMGGPMMNGPPPMMGPRGPGPFGPPNGPHGFRNFGPGPMRPHNPVRFLQKCGVNPDNFKDVPKHVLRLYLPDHCGVCRMDLASFTFARMHYTSKNHLKNQRKWLMESTTRSKAQEPLKSRDLYCELCDVQITSKVHAESHYSGKNHRAIVEGRKKPKNSKLSHDGSYQRLTKLIKREQRFMKMEETANDEAAREAIDRPVQKSEFYCEICKSAMSCSEQMTAHLNGKRHLTKEKQHILRMMKAPTAEGENKDDEGGDNVDSKNGDNNVTVVEDDEDEDEDEDEEDGGAGGEGDAAAGAADEDWVNGTGEGWDNTQADA